MASVPDGQAENQPFSVQTFSPPMATDGWLPSPEPKDSSLSGIFLSFQSNRFLFKYHKQINRPHAA
jgi:hypothetical protein